MIGFLPISIVSAGMSLLRTGAGALSAFFGSSDKQFTSTYASTLTANPAMHRTRLNSYLKPEPATHPQRTTVETTTLHSASRENFPLPHAPFFQSKNHQQQTPTQSSPTGKVSEYHVLYTLQNYEPFSSKNPVNKKSARKEDT